MEELSQVICDIIYKREKKGEFSLKESSDNFLSLLFELAVVGLQ